MERPKTDIRPLDVEAFADGNLPEEKASTVDDKLRKNNNALASMFGVARLNSLLRKARKKAYHDEALRQEISKIKDR